MNRLDVYLFRQSAVPFLLILACTTAVVWLTQVLQRMDLMVEDGGSLLSFLKVTVLMIPSLVGIITPFALLGAVLYTLNVLATDSELPVMASAGASRIRIGRPILLLAGLTSVLVFAINVDLQPRSYRVLKETVDLVRSDVARAFIRSGIFTPVMDGVTVYAEDVRPGDQYIGLLIHDARDPDDPITYTAEKGLFQVTRNGPRLLLAQGTIQRVDPVSQKTEILRFIETAIDMATLQSSDGIRSLEATERYISELLHPDLNDPYDAARANGFAAEAHARLSTPLYPIVFALISLLVLLRAPSSRKGYSGRLLFVLGAAIFVRTIGYILQSAATATPAVNILQYIWPLAIIVGCLVPLVGKFWVVKRRAQPDLRHVLDDPSRVEATA
ncbi:MAG: LptF/LptG family permease [Parvularcula sp.]